MSTTGGYLLHKEMMKNSHEANDNLFASTTPLRVCEMDKNMIAFQQPFHDEYQKESSNKLIINKNDNKKTLENIDMNNFIAKNEEHTFNTINNNYINYDNCYDNNNDNDNNNGICLLKWN